MADEKNADPNPKKVTPFDFILHQLHLMQEFTRLNDLASAKACLGEAKAFFHSTKDSDDKVNTNIEYILENFTRFEELMQKQPPTS